MSEGADAGAIRICDLTEDSRTAVPGSLFIARRGTKADGCRYIEPAIQCGAVAIITDRGDVLDELDPVLASKVVVYVSDRITRDGALIAERFYGNPAKELLIAGITGTNGKTTITHMAHQLIEAAGVRCGLIGTVEIDDGRECARAAMTTPPAVELSRTLATMREHGCQAVVMEVSSHALDQGRVDAMRFDACAFTNLTGDHLDYHQTIEHYQQSKAGLFELLKDDGLAAIGERADDAHGSSQRMSDACPKSAQIVRCVDGKSVRISDESIAGMTLEMTTPMGEISARVPIFGGYNATNTHQAVLIAQHVLSRAGLDHETIVREITEELTHLKLAPGRLERVHGGEDDVQVFVDFAHTDDALASVLGAVRGVLEDGAQLWCVFGCGGDRDTSKRARMGTVVSTIADRAVITSDNPRREPPSRIIDEIRTGIDESQMHKVSVQSDRSQAIAFAVANAKAGDVIMIAGKGHETEQISPDGMGGVRSVHFDDREHAHTALRERRLRQSTSAGQA